MSKRHKSVVLLWGLLWLGLGLLAGLFFLISVAGSEWRLALGLMIPLLAGAVGGGLLVVSALRSLAGARARPLRLPPTWALAGGLVLALAAGLGFWQAGISRAFLMPLFAAAAATLAPLAIVSWVLARQPGEISGRRASAALGLGATAGVSLAYLLNSLLSAAILFLIFGLAGTLLPLAENLLDALSFGSLTAELLSPWFLVALVEAAVVAPLVEELVKPLALLPLLRRLERPRDVLLLGALAGAGFAAVENILYAALFGSSWSGVLALRALGAALHPFGAGLMALAWWRVLRREPDAAVYWARNYGLAVGAHALWNGTCVVAAAVGYTWFRGWEVQLLGITDGVVLLALLALEGAALLVALRAVVRRLEPSVAGEEATPMPSLPTGRAVALWGLACLVVLLPVGLGLLRIL